MLGHWHPDGDDFGYPHRPHELDSFPHAVCLAELFRLDPRLASKIDPQPTGCWLWTGATVRSGYRGGARYGKLMRRRKMWLAHRYVYSVLVGPIPPGHDLHHRDCGETRCCNPLHSEPKHHTTHAVEHNLEDRRRLAA